MPNWKRVLTQLGFNGEELWDTLRYRLKKRMGAIGPLHILTYRGYGTPSAFYFKGRVLENKGIVRSTDRNTRWSNLLATFRRFESLEIPGARVRAESGEAFKEAVTDGEGYFCVVLRFDPPLSTTGVWHPVHVELLDRPHPRHGPVTATGQVVVPSPTSDFGIISDIDDTIIETHTTSLAKMAKMTFLHNARTRLPFKGVAAFYRALHNGLGGGAANPFFYVSRSPWNLYDLIEDFITVHHIPPGPLFLRDLSMEHAKGDSERPFDYKRSRIGTLLSTYPDLPFILIGDSGQNDPEIYRWIVNDFPGRILAVYIRDVTSHTRDARVMTIAKDLTGQGVEMVLSDHTEAPAMHAARNGWINPGALPEIRREKTWGKASGSDRPTSR
jgi:phosphatidate phosphatase APP1